jgi:uncharacterized protein (DUF305 family)
MSATHARRLTIALAAAACLTSACRSATRAPETGVPSATDTLSAADRAAISKARADSARYPYTVADIQFISKMIGHHAQAIEMARLAPTNGARASVQTLAERIINAQQDEITLMKQWLADRRQPLPDVHPTAHGMQHGNHAMMPGMITPDQMKQLEAARGAEFDRLFLTFMIQHHRGAVTMVRELFDTPGAAQDQAVFKIASDVNVDQTTEIARMSQMLATVIFEKPPE